MTCTAARSSAELREPARKLPEMPTMTAKEAPGWYAKSGAQSGGLEIQPSVPTSLP
jgi:hypothetical protein